MFRSAALTLTLCLATITAQAALLGRLPATPNGTDYQAYYDTDLNITWLANANLAASNTFGVAGINPDGTMDFATATYSIFGDPNWISAMNSASYLGYSDWRLPTTAQPDPTCDSDVYQPPYDLQGYGYNCTGSEMGHLYYVDGVTSSTPGPFSNVQAYYYWSDTVYTLSSAFAWSFDFMNGSQNYIIQANGQYAWAVRDGDIAPPDTAGGGGGGGGALDGFSLLALGLMGVMRRKLSS